MSKRRRNKRPPEGLFEAQIETLSDDGRGIARIEGKTTFIRGALAGEQVQFNYTNVTSRYDEGQAVEVMTPSVDRMPSQCPHSDICGGCSLHHMKQDAQLAHKQAMVAKLFEQISDIPNLEFWEPFKGPTLGYRTKARLGVRYVTKKEKVLVGFRESSSNKLAEISGCVVLDKRVGTHLELLQTTIASMKAYNAIAQIEVACGDKDVALIFRNMNALEDSDKEILTELAKSQNWQIYLQPKGPDTVTPLWPEKPEPLEYSICEGRIRHQFWPLDFTQVNTNINSQMVPAAIKHLDIQASDRVVDLFCGLGNFTLACALHSEHVIGVEGAQSLVERATQGAKNNGLADRVQFHFANLFEPWWILPWAKQPCDKLLLDPPRSGADEVVNNIEKLNPEKILYVSCHASTLARDAKVLVHEKGYRLAGIRVMDMFPHTAHIETMALFERIP